MLRLAITDDWQNIARDSADWSRLASGVAIEFFTAPLENPAETLRDFDIILPMRERMRFPRALLEALPNLKLLALTGHGTSHIDLDYCNERGIVCCGSGAYSPAAPAELTLALILAAARHVALGDAEMRAGRFQQRVPPGKVLEGAILGVIGLGRIGGRVAAYGKALGMKLLAWSPNLTAERAAASGATLVDKSTLLAQSDVVSLHLAYSPRSRGIIAAADLALLRPGGILINTARGPLIDEAALIAALRANRFTAALDVYDREPLPAEHPLRTLPNVVLSPHLGFSTTERMAEFYGESLENILAFLAGAPIRVLSVARSMAVTAQVD